MMRSTLFWVIMILWLVFGFLVWWPASGTVGDYRYAPVGGHVVLFVLLSLLGWDVYGPALKGK